MDKTISYYVKDFKTNKSIKSLFMAFYLVFKQGRFIELLYGLYGFLFFHPSKVVPITEKNSFFENYISKHLNQKYNGFKGLIYSEYLIQTFGSKYNFNNLPKDIRFRLPSILSANDWLVLGEYGDASGTIFFFTKNNVQSIDYYNKIKGFRHIHCIHQLNENELLITTGDNKKFLDLWTIESDKIKFKKRLMKNFAGFTAVASVNGEHYFGSDFSQRPNYIFRLSDKKKFFFPKEAYTMFVMYLAVLQNRYIISFNKKTADFGGKAVSVFDTQIEKFIYTKSITTDKTTGLFS